MTIENNISNSPFQDLLIVDIGGTVSTGFAGKLFADYGARVVNLEPHEGFATRKIKPYLQNGNSAMHGYLHANKESVLVKDSLLKHPAILKADLVLIDPSTLPDSISLNDFDVNVCVVSWFGLDGPYSKYEGSNEAIFALTGIMGMLGESDGPPIIPTGFHPQILGGLSAFNGALGYLFGQKENSQSATEQKKFRIDASIFEANMCLTDLGALSSYNGEPPHERLGINRFFPTYPLGIWPCKDGWLGVTVLSPSQWHSFCELLELQDLALNPKYGISANRLYDAEIIEPQILEALSHHSAEELFYKGQKMRIPLARVPTMAELFDVDQYIYRKAFSAIIDGETSYKAPSIPFRLFDTPPKFGGNVADLGSNNSLWDGLNIDDMSDQSLIGDTVSELPLQGVTIVDLAMGWAGPLAARNLADLGATVIKVEGCTRFDWFRSWEASQEWIDDNGAEKAINFIYVNRNKLDVTLDFEQQAGRDLLLKLIGEADAVIENYSGGVMPKLKLDYKVLSKINPELVMVSMPAFGSTGPWSSFRAYGSTVEQAAGLPHLQGNQQQPPTMLHVAFGDAIAGLYGTAALLTALFLKKNTGQGQFVDLSQSECLLPSAIHGVLHQSVKGSSPERQGNQRTDHIIHGVFPCRGDNNWLLIQIISEHEWRKAVCKISNLKVFEGLNSDEIRSEVSNIEKALSDWTKEGDARSLMQKLRSVGVKATVLNGIADLMEEPHLVAREYMQFVEREFVGVQPHPSSPWRIDKSPLPIRRSAPTLGQHNYDVLTGFLGLTADELASLEESDIIGNKPKLTNLNK